jgi:hypothetical protein
MKQKTKYALIAFMLSVYAVQLAHTVYDELNWPFTAHNLYYHRPSLVKSVFKITLEDERGARITVDPGNVLPIEGYRCGAILREVFVSSSDEEKKNAYAKMMIDRLNNGGWYGFDERRAPALPADGSKFVKLTLEKHRVDSRPFATTKTLLTLDKEKIFHYEKLALQ